MKKNEKHSLRHLFEHMKATDDGEYRKLIRISVMNNRKKIIKEWTKMGKNS